MNPDDDTVISRRVPRAAAPGGDAPADDTIVSSRGAERTIRSARRESADTAPATTQTGRRRASEPPAQPESGASRAVVPDAQALRSPRAPRPDDVVRVERPRPAPPRSGGPAVDHEAARRSARARARRRIVVGVIVGAGVVLTALALLVLLTM
ncbi:hypothetical protein [Microbacterium aureliae]